MTLPNIQALLRQHQNPSRAKNPLFFKTNSGNYAAHDQFLGISVPILRTVAQQYSTLSRDEITYLLQSPYNEERLLALFILIAHYRKANQEGKREIYHFYCEHIAHINNWNLVDASAHEIIGAYLFHYDRDEKILVALAQSDTMWHRRIAIVATLYFIRKSETAWTYDIARILLHDKQDLIHKATGWMLREAGKKDENGLRIFLDTYATVMPRTMLRYALEKFSPEDRALYMQR